MLLKPHLLCILFASIGFTRPTSSNEPDSSTPDRYADPLPIRSPADSTNAPQHEPATAEPALPPQQLSRRIENPPGLDDPRGTYHIVRSFHKPDSGPGEFARVRVVNEPFTGGPLPEPARQYVEYLAGKLRRELVTYLERTTTRRGGEREWAFVNFFDGGRRAAFGVDFETPATEDGESHVWWYREVIEAFFIANGLAHSAPGGVRDAFAYALDGHAVGHSAPGATVVGGDGAPEGAPTEDAPAHLDRRLGDGGQQGVRLFEDVWMYVSESLPGPDRGTARVRMFYEVGRRGVGHEELFAELGPRAAGMRDRLAARLPPWGQPRVAFVTALGGAGDWAEDIAVFGVDLEVRPPLRDPEELREYYQTVTDYFSRRGIEPRTEWGYGDFGDDFGGRRIGPGAPDTTVIPPGAPTALERRLNDPPPPELRQPVPVFVYWSGHATANAAGARFRVFYEARNVRPGEPEEWAGLERKAVRMRDLLARRLAEWDGPPLRAFVTQVGDESAVVGVDLEIMGPPRNWRDVLLYQRTISDTFTSRGIAVAHFWKDDAFDSDFNLVQIGPGTPHTTVAPPAPAAEGPLRLSRRLETDDWPEEDFRAPMDIVSSIRDEPDGRWRARIRVVLARVDGNEAGTPAEQTARLLLARMARAIEDRCTFTARAFVTALGPRRYAVGVDVETDPLPDELSLRFLALAIRVENAFLSAHVVLTHHFVEDAFAYDFEGRPVGPGAPDTTDVTLEEAPPAARGRPSRRLVTDNWPEVQFGPVVTIVESFRLDSKDGRVRVALEMGVGTEGPERERARMEQYGRVLLGRVNRELESRGLRSYGIKAFVTPLGPSRSVAVVDIEIFPYSGPRRLYDYIVMFVAAGGYAAATRSSNTRHENVPDAFAFGIGGHPIGPGAPGTTEVFPDDPLPAPPGRLSRRLETGGNEPPVDLRLPLNIAASAHFDEIGPGDSSAADRGFVRVRAVLEQFASVEDGDRARPRIERGARLLRARMDRELRKVTPVPYTATTFVTALGPDRFVVGLDIETSHIEDHLRTRLGHYMIFVRSAVLTLRLRPQQYLVDDAFAFEFDGHPVGPGTPGTAELPPGDMPSALKGRLARRLDELWRHVRLSSRVYEVRSEQTGDLGMPVVRSRIFVDRQLGTEEVEAARERIGRVAQSMASMVLAAVGGWGGPFDIQPENVKAFVTAFGRNRCIYGVDLQTGQIIDTFPFRGRLSDAVISIFPFPNFRLEHLLIEADAFAHQFEGRPIGPGAPDTTVLSVPARSPEESSVPRAVRARVARPEAQRDGHLGSESSPTEAGDDDSSSGFDPNNDQPEKRARHSRRQYSRPQVRPPWIREVLERPPPDQPAPPRPQPQPQPQRRLPVVNIVWSSNQVDGGPLMMRIRVFMVLRRRPEAEFDRADAMRRATYLSTQVRGRLEENPEEGGNRGFEGGGGRFEEWVSVTSQTEVAIGFDIQTDPALVAQNRFSDYQRDIRECFPPADFTVHAVRLVDAFGERGYGTPIGPSNPGQDPGPAPAAVKERRQEPARQQQQQQQQGQQQEQQQQQQQPRRPGIHIARSISQDYLASRVLKVRVVAFVHEWGRSREQMLQVAVPMIEQVRAALQTALPDGPGRDMGAAQFIPWATRSESGNYYLGYDFSIYAGSVRDQDLPLFFRDLRALYTPQRFEVREFNVPDAYSFRVNGVEVGPGRPGVRPPGAEQQWPESPRSAESDTAIVVWSNGHGLGTPEAHMRYRAFVVHDLRAGGESRGQQYVYAYALIEVVTRGLMRGGQREDSAVLTPFVSDLGAESVAVGFDMRTIPGIVAQGDFQTYDGAVRRALPEAFRDATASHVGDAFVYLHNGFPIGPARAVPEPGSGSSTRGGSSDLWDSSSDSLGIPEISSFSDISKRRLTHRQAGVGDPAGQDHELTLAPAGGAAKYQPLPGLSDAQSALRPDADYDYRGPMPLNTVCAAVSGHEHDSPGAYARYRILMLYRWRSPDEDAASREMLELASQRLADIAADCLGRLGHPRPQVARWATVLAPNEGAAGLDFQTDPATLPPKALPKYSHGVLSCYEQARFGVEVLRPERGPLTDAFRIRVRGQKVGPGISGGKNAPDAHVSLGPEDAARRRRSARDAPVARLQPRVDISRLRYGDDGKPHVPLVIATSDHDAGTPRQFMRFRVFMTWLQLAGPPREEVLQDEAEQMAGEVGRRMTNSGFPGGGGRFQWFFTRLNRDLFAVGFDLQTDPASTPPERLIQYTAGVIGHFARYSDAQRALVHNAFAFTVDHRPIGPGQVGYVENDAGPMMGRQPHPDGGDDGGGDDHLARRHQVPSPGRTPPQDRLRPLPDPLGRVRLTVVYSNHDRGTAGAHLRFRVFAQLREAGMANLRSQMEFYAGMVRERVERSLSECGYGAGGGRFTEFATVLGPETSAVGFDIETDPRLVPEDGWLAYKTHLLQHFNTLEYVVEQIVAANAFAFALHDELIGPGHPGNADADAHGLRRRQEYREPENGPPVVDLLTGEVPLAERHVERIIIAWSEHGRGAEGAFLRLRFAVQISGGVPTEGTPTSTYFNGLAVFTFATVADILSMEPRFAGAGGRFTPYVTGLGRRAVVIGFDAETDPSLLPERSWRDYRRFMESAISQQGRYERAIVLDAFEFVLDAEPIGPAHPGVDGSNNPRNQGPLQSADARRPLTIYSSEHGRGTADGQLRFRVVRFLSGSRPIQQAQSLAARMRRELAAHMASAGFSHGGGEFTPWTTRLAPPFERSAMGVDVKTVPDALPPERWADFRAHLLRFFDPARYAVRESDAPDAFHATPENHQIGPGISGPGGPAKTRLARGDSTQPSWPELPNTNEPSQQPPAPPPRQTIRRVILAVSEHDAGTPEGFMRFRMVFYRNGPDRPDIEGAARQLAGSVPYLLYLQGGYQGGGAHFTAFATQLGPQASAVGIDFQTDPRVLAPGQWSAYQALVRQQLHRPEVAVEHVATADAFAYTLDGARIGAGYPGVDGGG